MRNKKINENQIEEIFNTVAVDEVYPKTGEIVQWLHIAMNKGYISKKEYNTHRDNLMDIVMIFQPRSKYGKKTKKAA